MDILTGMGSTEPMAPSTGGTSLVDLFSNPTPQTQPEQTPYTPQPQMQNPQPQMQNQPQPAGMDLPSMNVYADNTVAVIFNLHKPDPQNMALTYISANVLNKANAVMTNFAFQTAPPPHAKFQVGKYPKQIPPGGSIQVPIKALNSAVGSQELAMKVRILFTVNGKSGQVQHVVRGFPNGV